MYPTKKQMQQARMVLFANQFDYEKSYDLILKRAENETVAKKKVALLVVAQIILRSATNAGAI